MMPPTPRVRLLGATAISLLIMLSGGCSDLISSAPSVTALNYNTHKDFPINSGEHAKADCNTCHGDFSTFQQFNCTSCHEHSQAATDPKHAGVTGYTWNGTSCYECHPDGKGSAVDHEQFFPIAAQTTHANIACSTCHVDPANRKNVDCISCHPSSTTDPQHSAVGGYAQDSTLCIRCHGDSQVNAVSTHLPFLIRSRTRHYRNSCLTCHPSNRTDKPWATNFTPFDCLGCHGKTETDGHHRSISGYQYVSSTCVNSGCHPSGRAP